MHVHLVGICGTGMGSLAGLFQAAGHTVTGSDTQCYPPISTMLEQLGIPVQIGFAAEQVLQPRPDLVVIGNVCTRSNPEARAAIDTKIRYFSLPHAMARYFCAGRLPIMCTGTHGKTTSSALMAWLLTAADQDPTFLVGGIPHNFGVSYTLGKGRHVVLEGDEYDTAFFDKTPKFLHYGAQAVMLGPVEFDHADIYRDLDAVLAAFRTLIAQLPVDALLVACTDSEHVRALLPHARSRVVTYGLESAHGPDVTARDVHMGPAGTTFEIIVPCPSSHRGQAPQCRPGASWQAGVGPLIIPRPSSESASGVRSSLAPFHSPLVGRQNLQNTVGVLAMLQTLGIDPDRLRTGLAQFRGIKRRQEVIGEPRGITIIDDFAHHPTAIRETLDGLRAQYPERRLLVAFEPRSNTSGRRLFHAAYLEAFAGAQRVWIAPVHKRDRIPEADRLDVGLLARELTDRGITTQAASAAGIREALCAQAKPGDVVVLLSNGDFDGLREQLPVALQRTSG